MKLGRGRIVGQNQKRLGRRLKSSFRKPSLLTQAKAQRRRPRRQTQADAG